MTAEERNWVQFLKQSLGDLSLIPQVVEHWRKAGAGSITPILVPEAVRQFKAWALPQVKRRARADINWRLNVFARAFPEPCMYQLNAGEIETWL